MRIQIGIIALFLGMALTSSLKAGTDVTVSGLSSGAFMAVQVHIANSKTVRGSGVFAGGPYYCAKGSMMTALTTCMSTGFGIDIPGIKRQMQAYEKAGKIDAVSNLSGQKVFIFSGKSDSTVCNKVAVEGEKLYKDLGASVETKYDFAASHTMPTKDYGTLCTLSMKPFIGKCNYNGAFQALNSLYDDKLTEGSGKYNKSNLYSVSQTTTGTVMGPKAYSYLWILFSLIIIY